VTLLEDHAFHFTDGYKAYYALQTQYTSPLTLRITDTAAIKTVAETAATTTYDRSGSGKTKLLRRSETNHAVMIKQGTWTHAYASSTTSS
jgi:hypothetical protein